MFFDGRKADIPGENNMTIGFVLVGRLGNLDGN